VVLRGFGVHQGQTVLDFGCGEGTYTIPAAKIVGNRGMVYALDQAENRLDTLQAKAKSAGLENIRIMLSAAPASVELADESVDFVLLYDVLHSWYHPQSQQRRQILRELHRVLRLDGVLSFYPGDPEVFGHYSELAAIQREISESDFCLQRRQMTTLIHEGSVVEGCVFSFIKNCR